MKPSFKFELLTAAMGFCLLGSLIFGLDASLQAASIITWSIFVSMAAILKEMGR